MNNIKELMKEDIRSYSKKERKKLIEIEESILGETRCLTIVMEELAELNEVISSNTLNKVDYIHTAEEIADVIICAEIVQSVCGVAPKELTKPSKIKKHVLIASVRNISKAQQDISKYIRYHKDSYNKVIEAVNLINDTIPALISLFKIKKKDVSKIVNIKVKRREERIENGTLH